MVFSLTAIITLCAVITSYFGIKNFENSYIQNGIFISALIALIVALGLLIRVANSALHFALLISISILITCALLFLLLAILNLFILSQIYYTIFYLTLSIGCTLIVLIFKNFSKLKFALMTIPEEFKKNEKDL